MINSRGFDIAITTIILIIIGVAILIGMVFFVKNGFGFLKSGTEPLLKTQSVEATRQACELICRSENEIAFCCDNVGLNDEQVSCLDKRLGVDCSIDCSEVVCS